MGIVIKGGMCKDTHMGRENISGNVGHFLVVSSLRTSGRGRDQYFGKIVYNLRGYLKKTYQMEKVI